MGLALIEPDEVIGDSFEARVCPLALAAVTGVFDHDPAVISVVEKAQFRGRRISIHHCASTAEITMRAALTSDCGLRSEEQTFELQSLMLITYVDFCLTKQT